MGKPIRVTLEKNQFVVTERQYTVSLLMHKYLPNATHDIILTMRTIRATSANEALGQVIDAVRKDKEYHRWVIANFILQETGD